MSDSPSSPKILISSTAQGAVIPPEAGLPYESMSAMFDHIRADGVDTSTDPMGLDAAQPSRTFAICLVPRSGSTYLGFLLRDTGLFGFPNEWLALALAEKEARETASGDWDSLFRRILARYASPNGVSGIELALAHLTWGREAAGRKQLLDRSMQYFYLRRRNIVQQAISMHVAHTSGVLHSFQVNEDANSARDAVQYDQAAIRTWIKFLQDEELKWEREFGALKIEPVRLYYEDVVARPDRALRLFANVLGIEEIPRPGESEIKRMGSDRTDAWEAQYREDDADFLAALARHRPFLHTLQQTT